MPPEAPLYQERHCIPPRVFSVFHTGHFRDRRRRDRSAASRTVERGSVCACRSGSTARISPSFPSTSAAPIRHISSGSCRQRTRGSTARRSFMRLSAAMALARTSGSGSRRSGMSAGTADAHGHLSERVSSAGSRQNIQHNRLSRVSFPYLMLSFSLPHLNNSLRYGLP